MAFGCVTPAFSWNGLFLVLYLINYDLVLKSQCTYYFLQEMFPNSPGLGKFPIHVFPQPVCLSIHKCLSNSIAIVCLPFLSPI